LFKMAKICLLLCAFLGYAAIARAQTPVACAGPINTLMQCVETAEQTKDAAFEAMIKTGDQCFATYACAAPKFGEEHEHKHEEKEKKTPTAEELVKEQEMNASRHCFEAIDEQIKSTVEQCVSTATGLTPPTGGKKQGHRRPEEHPHFKKGEEKKGEEKKGEEKKGEEKKGDEKQGGGSGGKAEEETKMLEKLCANGTGGAAAAAASVEACLAPLKVQAKTIHEAFCGSKNACREGYLGNAGCTWNVTKEAKEAARKEARVCVNSTRQQFETIVSGLSTPTGACQGVQNITAGFKHFEEREREEGHQGGCGEKGKEEDGKGKGKEEEEKAGKKEEEKAGKKEEPKRKGEEPKGKGEERSRGHEKHLKESRLDSCDGKREEKKEANGGPKARKH